jgi:hypothetical protein
VQKPIRLFYFLLLSSAFILTRCANPVSPQGGSKDDTPPAVLECEPPNLSTSFTGNTIRIDFSEFVQLKNPITEILVSPPLKTSPDTRLRGKSLIVRLEDSLAGNTTYSVNFGNAIADITEGNILKGFSYVFSTGSYIDTLSIRGTLQGAFDRKPQKDIYVQLYINNNDTLPFDSLPVKVPPYYITKSDELGNVELHHLQNEQYKLFALADQNGDLIFNQPSEKIAFFDSLVTPYYIRPSIADSLPTDSLLNLHDTLIVESAVSGDITQVDDSLRRADTGEHTMTEYPVYPLFLFQETDSVQRINQVNSAMEHMVLIVFRFPVAGFRIVPLGNDTSFPWILPEISAGRDSLRLWITRPDVDSLVAEVFINNLLFDTIRNEIMNRDPSPRGGKKQRAPKLGITSPVKGSSLNQFKDKLMLDFSYPLTRWDFSRVLLLTAQDTVTPPILFYDSLRRKIIIDHPWKEEENYRILIPDSVFHGIHDISHDTVRIDFRTKGERDVGNLLVTVNIDMKPGQYIVQLLNEKETVVYEQVVISEPGQVRFSFMPPGKYKLKAIHDGNSNNRWDTGSYKLKLQPEEVIYFDRVIEIRANWDVEEIWN